MRPVVTPNANNRPVADRERVIGGEQAGAPFLELTGSPYEMGLQHGKTLESMIVGFLSDRHARVNYLRRSPISRAKIYRRVRPYIHFVERLLPEIAEEIHGLASGAGIPIESAMLLQVRRELVGYTPFSPGECTLVASRRPGKGSYIAQTVDLNGNVGGLGVVLKISPNIPGRPRALVYTLAGLLGLVGMNDVGVAVGINLVLSGRWRPGIPPYLLVRHLLTLSSVGECIEALKKLPRSSSRALTICDRDRLANVEMTVDELRVNEGDMLCHTNHLLDRYLASKDRINPFSWRSSFERLCIMEKKAEAMRDLEPPEVLAAFRDHSLYPYGICVHAEGEMRRDETVATVMMEPSLSTFHVAVGHACASTARRFDFGQANVLTKAAG